MAKAHKMIKSTMLAYTLMSEAYINIYNVTAGEAYIPTQHTRGWGGCVTLPVTLSGRTGARQEWHNAQGRGDDEGSHQPWVQPQGISHWEYWVYKMLGLCRMLLTVGTYLSPHNPQIPLHCTVNIFTIAPLIASGFSHFRKFLPSLKHWHTKYKSENMRV